MLCDAGDSVATEANGSTCSPGTWSTASSSSRFRPPVRGSADRGGPAAAGCPVRPFRRRSGVDHVGSGRGPRGCGGGRSSARPGLRAVRVRALATVTTAAERLRAFRTLTARSRRRPGPSTWAASARRGRGGRPGAARRGPAAGRRHLVQTSSPSACCPCCRRRRRRARCRGGGRLRRHPARRGDDAAAEFGPPAAGRHGARDDPAAGLPRSRLRARPADRARPKLVVRESTLRRAASPHSPWTAGNRGMPAPTRRRPPAPLTLSSRLPRTARERSPGRAGDTPTSPRVVRAASVRPRRDGTGAHKPKESPLVVGGPPGGGACVPLALNPRPSGTETYTPMTVNPAMPSTAAEVCPASRRGAGGWPRMPLSTDR